MIRRTFRGFVQILGALGAGMAIMLVLAAWRLSSGPITLAFLSPYIERALSAEDGSLAIRLDDTILTWAGWVVVAFGVFIAVSAIWNPRLLMPFQRERRLDVRPSQLGAWAPPVMGVAFGFGWTPCIGPTLAAILTIAGTQDTVAEGMFLLFIYSMGLGVPFVLAGIGMTRAYASFGWFKRHFTAITVTSGVLLAVFGILMVTGKLVELNRWFQQILPEFLWDV
ncbi:MAG: cytochrome c biogenesis protein CcdA [Rhodospirillales bacterium]|nr:cytochrome c biogenesis protein CcdA [Rhodospirillales bacterium]